MRTIALLVAGLVLVPAVAWAAPNDALYDQQWGLRKIRAESAWAVSKGAGAIVAVIDTGVYAGHPDLRGRVLRGRDFVDDDDNAADENGHGTLIAGIIAATTGNGIGIASVAPRAKILPVRVLDENGNGSATHVAQGIDWAVERGADVINLSLAEERSSGLLDDLLRDPSIDRAIRRAAERGRTVVVAAGNDEDGGQAETAYDATVEGVLVVGASTKTDRRAAYSRYGAGLDLLAPGGGSASDPSGEACTVSNAIASTWWKSGQREAYGATCGTSAAVAFVSGVAAQLHARGHRNTEVAQRILTRADDLGPRGRDDETGYGRLNAARALGASTTTPGPSSSPTPVVRRSSPPPQTRVQGTSTPIRRESVTPTPSPAASDTLAPDPPAHAAGPDARGEPTRARWPVSVAAFLAGLMVLAHYWRWVGARQRR